MKTRIMLAALLLAARALHAQMPDECRDTFRGSRQARAAHQDSVKAARARLYREVADDIRAAARAAGTTEAAGVVVVAMDSARHPVVTPIDINFPVDALRDVVPRLVDRVAVMPGPGLACGGLVFRLDTLPRPTSDSAKTGPALLNGPEVNWFLQEWTETHAERGSRNPTVSAVVLRDGNSVLHRIVQSSGSTVVDEFALEMIRAARFRPGTVGGVPEDMFGMVPIQLAAAPSGLDRDPPRTSAPPRRAAPSKP